MFDTPKHEVVQLKGVRYGNLITISAQHDNGSRLIFPQSYEALKRIGMEVFGLSGAGKHRYRECNERTGTTIGFMVVGRVYPEALQLFTDKIQAVKSIGDPDFTFQTWLSNGHDKYRYLPSFSCWRIGTRDNNARIFPVTERIREICAHFCTPNVLIQGSKPSDGFITNHVILSFEDMIDALVIDKITYHIAEECSVVS